MDADSSFNPNQHTPQFCFDAVKEGKKVGFFLLNASPQKVYLNIL